MNNPDNEQLANAIEKLKTALDLFSEEATGAEYTASPFGTRKWRRGLDAAMLEISHSIARVEEVL